MTRALVAGLVGIAALLVSSVAAISFTTRDDAPARSLSAPGDRTPLEAPPPISSPAAGAAAAVLPGPDNGVFDPAVVAVSRPPSRSAQDALPPETHRARISFRGQLTAGMAELQKRASRCAPSNAALKLDVETVAGGIRVLDVQPEPGVSTEEDVACARAALKGQLIPAADAEPGRRWQMPLTIRSSR